MSAKASDRTSSFAGKLGSTLKSIVKILAQSRKCDVSRADVDLVGKPLIVMGNGPSLSRVIAEEGDKLARYPSMAVNFAANADEFVSLRPDYYVLCDPHFFSQGDGNVDRLWERLRTLVKWPMTLFVPAKHKKAVNMQGNSNIRVQGYNPVGVEGYEWLENLAYSSGRGMPRPRNVLIPAIMIGVNLGYKDIYVVGADHSWMKTLEVNEKNQVVSVQPHFYKDNATESARVTAVYADIPLHSVIESFYVAFRAYHRIRRYADSHNVNIYNSTPGSYIDAFIRRPLP